MKVSWYIHQSPSSSITVLIPYLKLPIPNLSCLTSSTSRDTFLSFHNTAQYNTVVSSLETPKHQNVHHHYHLPIFKINSNNLHPLLHRLTAPRQRKSPPRIPLHLPRPETPGSRIPKSNRTPRALCPSDICQYGIYPWWDKERGREYRCV